MYHQLVAITTKFWLMNIFPLVHTREVIGVLISLIDFVYRGPNASFFFFSRVEVDLSGLWKPTLHNVDLKRDKDAEFSSYRTLIILTLTHQFASLDIQNLFVVKSTLLITALICSTSLSTFVSYYTNSTIWLGKPTRKPVSQSAN